MVFAAYAMLLALVCPDIPTPIYTCKDRPEAGKTLYSPPTPVAASAPILRLEIAPVVACFTPQRGDVRDLTCQRLC